MRVCAIVVGSFFLLVCVVMGQNPYATVTGRVVDPANATIVGAKVEIVNSETGVKYSVETNSEGIYTIPNLQPGIYRMEVSKPGFKALLKPDIVLHVQDVIAINFSLPLGSVSETVTVEGGAPLINTESAAVSTVIDRNFAGSLPLNGRSFNTLLQLTPGVVITSGSVLTPGQFSVNGQRTDSNYFQVDGVSANFGVNAPQAQGFFLNQGGNGSGQAFNAFGGTSSLVSVDAMQEFRVETSSFAPEYGRTPGGQVMITTRSGTNDFHGTVFDYFRNTVLDANDWFANAAGKQRAPEQQNDFGGVFGGPILKNKTFFFLSYEGLRLLQPQTTVILVPSASIRASAVPAAAPVLNAFPLPDPNAPVIGNGSTARFTGNYSNRITSDAGSFRIDHSCKDGLAIFGRFNWAPSATLNRVNNLSNIQKTDVGTRTVTLGLNQQISPRFGNSFRFNYSKQTADVSGTLDTFGGAQSLDPGLLLPNPFSLSRNFASVDPIDLQGVTAVIPTIGKSAGNAESQFNILDDLSLVKGAHQFKIGGDYRQLTLTEVGSQISPVYIYLSTSSFASSGSFVVAAFRGFHPGKLALRNISTYSQDRWSIGHRLTLTYGLRWEINPAPSPEDGTVLAAWQNVNSPQSTGLAPAGTPIFNTSYGNFAPRVGGAYRLDSKGNFVIRGGWGMFYDLGTSIAPLLLFDFPNQASTRAFGVQLPVPNFASFAPTFSGQCPCRAVTAFDPALKLPYSYQWNVAIERSLWGRQAVSISYVGQAGRRQRRNDLITQTSATLPSGYQLITNGGSSDYNALQIQYKRPLYQRLQALLNYTWSHSIDTASDDVSEQVAGLVSPVTNNRGSSDFDVRHNFSGTLIYELPAAKKNPLLKLTTENWSLGGVWQVRSGFPINIFAFHPAAFGFALARPDLVPGHPIWIPDPTSGPGKKLNPNAFAVPATARQGNLGRNSIYGLGAGQIDLTIQRAFPLTERIRLSFRTDAFNILNHPNFANPGGSVGAANFGIFTQMLNRGLGGLNPLYQIGGPRSLQLSLRLAF